jgi:hypothetical protein
MSIDIFVQRGAGDRRGDDIVDPLIGSIPVAIQRGRNELDGKALSPQRVQAECVFRTGLRLGQLARFYDFDTGEIWNGKVAGIQHTQKGVVLTTRLQIEKPTDFFL